MFSKGGPHYTLLQHMDRVNKTFYRADQIRNMTACVGTAASLLTELNL